MATARNDQENLRILEQTRPVFEKLQRELIGIENDIKRLELEKAAAAQAAIDELGTDDLPTIRKMIEETRIENTRKVDEFTVAVKDVEERLREAGAQA